MSGKLVSGNGLPITSIRFVFVGSLYRDGGDMAGSWWTVRITATTRRAGPQLRRGNPYLELQGDDREPAQVEMAARISMGTAAAGSQSSRE
jgi:hypothetical protein